MIEHNWFNDARTNQNLSQKLHAMRLLICDVDGCLTNGVRLSHEDGHSKQFSYLDGLGIKMAMANGVKVAFVTGDTSPITAARAQKLGIPEDLCRMVHWSEKPEAVRIIQQTYDIAPEETIVVGDDVPDLALKPQAGLFACPNDALFYIQKNADLVLPRAGGTGAVRLLLDLILLVKGNHPYEELF